MQENGELLEEAGANFIEQQDRIHGKNKDITEQIPEQPNLGRSTSPMVESTIGGANDSHWKNVPLENLPSRGLFYPDDAEITIKAASVSEIRQWSTIDENDKLDVDDNLNFIIEKCCRLKIKGGKSWLTWRDISELDRLALVFLIQELSFPDDQNSLFVKFTCPGPCIDLEKWKDEVRVRSHMLSFIEFPEEVMQY